MALTDMLGQRDIWSDYNDTVQAPLDKYRAKTSRMKYAGDREYQNFRNSVFVSTTVYSAEERGC